MRKKFFQWMMAAILICGASVFTSCSSDDNDAASQAAENRNEFIAHCRSNLKELAENLNFGTWEGINQIATDFNKNVLNNPAFENTVGVLFFQQAWQNQQPVVPGSELDQLGYQNFTVIDFTSFNYRFTPKADNTGFDYVASDEFQLIFKRTQEAPPAGAEAPEGAPAPPSAPQQDLYECLVLKASGGYVEMIESRLSSPALAIILRFPESFEFTLGRLLDDGSVDPRYNGTFKNEFVKKSASSYVSLITDAWNVSGTLTSNVTAPAAPEGEVPQAPEGMKGPQDDALKVNFAIGQDPTTHESGIKFDYTHNGKEILRVRGVMENLNGLTDYTQFNSSMGIAEMFLGIMAGNNIKEGELTLLNDLTGTLKVTDCAKVIEIQNRMARARRNYADEATIDQFTQQLNELVSGSMTCAHTNQTIPMQLKTVKFGVDYWAMPALKFGPESEYEPLTNLLDNEGIAYMINIADHAAEPMQESIVIVRQLMQYFQTIMGLHQNQQFLPNQQNQQNP
jgi:hypothetical protein